MTEFILIIVTAVFINNFVVVQFLGICPFLGVSKSTSGAFGMGIAVTFVMTLTCFITYPLYEYLLVPLGLEYLEIIVFIFVIAALVQMIEMVIKKFSPALYRTMGIYLPLITTNCCVLGAAELNAKYDRGILASTVFGLCSGVGFAIAVILFASLRERLEISKIPRPFQGAAIALITAGILAMAFMGFSGLVK